MNLTRESVFLSATRCFCNSFAFVFGIVIAIALIFTGISILSSPIAPPSKNEIVIAPDSQGNRSILPESAPVILRINIHGVIGDGFISTETISNILLDSQSDVIRPNRVKGILLHMNTPGGTVTDADGIYRLILAYKEKYQVPVYAFVDGMCASGGMYICSAADKIYATNPSVIGSIGVILGPTFNFSDAMDKVGVKSLTIKQGKDKDALNPFRPWIPGEDQSLVNITKTLYDQFVEIVVSARKNLDKQKLINEYGAQVFLAGQAQEYGYIDVANSNYQIALKDLASAANISEKTEYQVIQLETPVSIISSLMKGQSSLITGKVEHVLNFGSNISPNLSGKLLYLYTP